jgi:hypothetical protein
LTKRERQPTVDGKNYSSRMYSDTIVLSGPEVMLSSSASVAASHSPRPQSAPIGSPGSAGVAGISPVSALRGAGQLTAVFGMV